jgi:hypothetical protein
VVVHHLLAVVPDRLRVPQVLPFGLPQANAKANRCPLGQATLTIALSVFSLNVNNSNFKVPGVVCLDLSNDASFAQPGLVRWRPCLGCARGADVLLDGGLVHAEVDPPRRRVFPGEPLLLLGFDFE